VIAHASGTEIRHRAKRGRPRSHLFCHAERKNAREPGTPCDTFLGVIPAALDFITTADEAPLFVTTNGKQGEADMTVWLRCSNKRCGKWNRFRIVPP
jgi:hypothetical protein